MRKNKKFTTHPVFSKPKNEKTGGFVPHPIFKDGTHSFSTRMTIDMKYEQSHG